MKKDLQRIRKVYDKTDGYCHLCHKKLALSNYGKTGSRGSWHFDHSFPRANGGSDHLNNLYAACIVCNVKKGTRRSYSVRKQNGLTTIPKSKSTKAKIRDENTGAGLILGGILGSFGGPVGMLIGAAIGGILGNNEEV